MSMIDVTAFNPVLHSAKTHPAQCDGAVPPTSTITLCDSTGYPGLRIMSQHPDTLREIANAMLAEADTLEKEINA